MVEQRTEVLVFLVRLPVAPLENEAVGFNLTAFSFISGHIFGDNKWWSIARWVDGGNLIVLTSEYAL